MFSFFFNPGSFFKILICSEIIWVILYMLAVFFGSFTGDLVLITISLFFFCLAGLEFSVGFILILLFKESKKKIAKHDNSKIFRKFYKNFQ